MSLKRFFLPQRARKQILEDYPTEIQTINETNEEDDIIEYLPNLNSDEQQHRKRRQSSIQIFDIKLLHTLSNPIDNESNYPINVPKDVCECE